VPTLPEFLAVEARRHAPAYAPVARCSPPSSSTSFRCPSRTLFHKRPSVPQLPALGRPECPRIDRTQVNSRIAGLLCQIFSSWKPRGLRQLSSAYAPVARCSPPSSSKNFRCRRRVPTCVAKHGALETERSSYIDQGNTVSPVVHAASPWLCRGFCLVRELHGQDPTLLPRHHCH